MDLDFWRKEETGRGEMDIVMREENGDESGGGNMWSENVGAGKGEKRRDKREKPQEERGEMKERGRGG